MNFEPKKYLKRGKESWILDLRRIGQGRLFFTKQSLAARAAKEVNREGAVSGNVWKQLTEPERFRLATVFHKAQKLGYELEELLALAEENPRGNAGHSIRSVMTELKLVKLQAGRDAGYVANLLLVLGQFAKGREGWDVGRFTVQHVEAHLGKFSLAYRATLRSRLATLFKFAVRRRYRLDNPCEQLESITAPQKPPEIFSVTTARRSIEWLLANAPQGLGWFALSMGCGLRPEEGEQTEPKRDIDFVDGHVSVEAQTSKMRQRGIVYPRPEAMAFLQWALDNGGVLPLKSQVRRRILSGVKWPDKAGVTQRRPGLRQHLEWKVWPKDITRHTAASYWLALEPVKVVAKALRHSERTCESRYKAVSVDGEKLTRAKAEEFWKMLDSFTTKTRRH